MAKRGKKIILKDQDAIERLNFLAPLYDNASLDEVAVIAINFLWGKKASLVADKIAQLTSEIKSES